MLFKTYYLGGLFKLKQIIYKINIKTKETKIEYNRTSYIDIYKGKGTLTITYNDTSTIKSIINYDHINFKFDIDYSDINNHIFKLYDLLDTYIIMNSYLIDEFEMYMTIYRRNFPKNIRITDHLRNNENLRHYIMDGSVKHEKPNNLTLIK